MAAGFCGAALLGAGLAVGFAVFVFGGGGRMGFGLVVCWFDLKSLDYNEPQWKGTYILDVNLGWMAMVCGCCRWSPFFLGSCTLRRVLCDRTYSACRKLFRSAEAPWWQYSTISTLLVRLDWQRV